MADKAAEMTREQKVAQVQATAELLIDFIADKPHATTLDALLLVYEQLAIKFPCCTQNAANLAMQIAMRLAQQAALGRVGQTSTSVH